MTMKIIISHSYWTFIDSHSYNGIKQAQGEVPLFFLPLSYCLTTWGTLHHRLNNHGHCYVSCKSGMTVTQLFKVPEFHDQ